MNKDSKYIDSFEMPKGLEIDIEEGWNKIINRQFGGDPGRGFGELIQNLIDSYPESVPMDERRGIINSTDHSISIRDFGSGFSLEKLKLIVTLGGTDKSGDKTKIGQFGIGFFSIFNEALATSEVMVTTKCKNYTIQVRFIVHEDGKVPEIKTKVLDDEIDFSTEILVKFREKYSSDACLRYARESLEYYPCKISINGLPFKSIWADAAQKNWHIFERENCNGIIKSGYSSSKVKVLCKYEQIINLSLNNLLSASNMPAYTLDDYDTKSFPYVPNIELIVNCNNLNLTISRDSFYLDYSYDKMLGNLKEEFFRLLSIQNFKSLEGLALANAFILRFDVAYFIKNNKLIDSWSTHHKKVIEKIAKTRMFKIAGRSGKFSLVELKKMLTDGLPLYYSQGKNNLRWLGGKFKHDYILLPDRCYIEQGADNFYNKLLETIFGDIVNLDRIQGNTEAIKKLVERDIVSKKALEPTVEFVGENKLNSRENEMLEGINRLLRNEEVISAIKDNLYLNIRNIRAVFFEIKKEGAYISTGIFDESMNPVNDDFISNFERIKDKNNESGFNSPSLLLGLRKDHPLIQQLMDSNNDFKEYYAITYIAHELTSSQKLLVPYSSFFNWTRERLAGQIRRALIKSLVKKAA